MKVNNSNKAQLKGSQIFAVAGLILFSFVALSFGFIYKKFNKSYLIKIEQEKAINFTQVLANSLSFEIEKLIDYSELMSDEKLRQLPQITKIDNDIKKYTEGIDSILRVKIYNFQRKTVFSTDITQLCEVKKTDYEGFESSRFGKIESEIQFEENINSIMGQKKNLYVLLNYLPLRNPKTHEVYGVIEVGSNIGPALANISNNSNFVIMICLLLFMVILITVYLIIKKFENISDNQLAIIQENQDKLFATSKLASIGELAGGIAHEINNPLMIIQGFAEQIQSNILSNQYEPKTTVKELGIMIQTISRIAIIVESLKKLENHRQPEALSKAPVSEILKEAIELCRSKFSNNNIEVKISSIPDNLKVYCHPVGVSQVVINLLNNSYDAIIDKDKPWIEIKTKVINRVVRIELIDCGNGIDKSIATKIMDPFFTTKGVGKGTGLGLSISAKILKDQNGRLYLDPNSENTKFVIELALAE